MYVYNDIVITYTYVHGLSFQANVIITGQLNTNFVFVDMLVVMGVTSIINGYINQLNLLHRIWLL